MPDSMKITVDANNDTATVQVKENVGNLVFTLTSEDDSAIKGAKFTIKNSNNNLVKFAISNGVYIPSANGNEVLETNTAGKFTIEKLPVGEYTLIQTEAPSKYNGTLITKSFTMTIGNQLKINGVNTEEYGKVTINAIDNKTTTALKNSEYNVLDKTGNKLTFEGSAGAYVYTTTGGSNSLKTNNNGSLVVEGLPVGEYTLVEVATPVGYDKIANMTFYITKNQETTVTVKNIKSVGSLEIIASDATTKVGVSDYTFNITTTNGVIMKFRRISDGSYAYATDGTVQDLVTDINGKIVISDLPIETLMVKQIKAAKGYMLDRTGIQQNIESQKTTQYIVEVSKSNASLNVITEDNEPIQEIPVIIKDADGKIAFEGVTNENGKVLITGISAGNYTYIIENLKSPYMNKTYSQTFSINSKGEVTGLDSCILEYNKLMVSLSEKIEGAQFKLTNKDNPNMILLAKTDADGIATFTKVSDGEYILTQSEAPEGYEISTKEETVVIDRNYKSILNYNFENGEITEESTEDETIPGNSESTGNNDKDKITKPNTIIIIVGLVILLVIGATIYAVIKTKKDDEKEEKNAPTPQPEVQKQEPQVTTPIIPVVQEEPEMFEEVEEEIVEEVEEIPDMDLTRPDVEEFNSDPYEQEEIEKNQENSEDYLLTAFENTEVEEIDESQEVVEETDDEEDLLAVFNSLLEQVSDETGNNMSEQKTPAKNLGNTLEITKEGNDLK